MILTFENIYPYPASNILEIVIKSDIEKLGKFNIETSDVNKMVHTAHHGEIPGEMDVPRQFRTFLSEGTIRWSFNYDWDPITFVKTWHVHAYQYADYITWNGHTTYQAIELDGKSVTRQQAVMNLTLNLPFFQDTAEKKLIERLIQQAQDDYYRIMSTMNSISPISREDRLFYENKFQYKIERGDEMNRPNKPFSIVFELMPFWLGTIMTSVASGFFISQSLYSWITPFIFVALLLGLFLIAFTSVSAARKNDFGLFLALFTSCYWLGVFFATK